MSPHLYRTLRLFNATSARLSEVGDKFKEIRGCLGIVVHSGPTPLGRGKSDAAWAIEAARHSKGPVCLILDRANCCLGGKMIVSLKAKVQAPNSWRARNGNTAFLLTFTLSSPFTVVAIFQS